MHTQAAANLDSSHLLQLMAYGFEQQEALAGIMDAEGRMLYANRAALEAVGATLDEIIGCAFRESPWRRHSQQSQEIADHLLEKALRGERAVVEDDIINAAGVRVPVLFSVSPVYGENGEIIALIPEGKVVTELKHLQSRLERERWETRQWLDSLVSYVIRCTPKGEIIFCNKPLLNALELELQELVGTNFLDLRWPGNTPHGRSAMEEAFHTARAGGRATFEITYERSDEPINTVLISVSPIFDREGMVSFMAAEAKNITEQVQMREALLAREREISTQLEAEVERATRALRETARFNQDLIDTLPMGIILLDQENRAVFANPEMQRKLELVGLTGDAIKGLGLEEIGLSLPDGVPGAAAELHFSSAGTAMSLLLLAHPGGKVVFETVSAPVLDPDGKHKGTVMILNDVTRRHRLEEELCRTRVQSEKLTSLGKLVSGVAHEVNNPLTTIIGCAEFLAEVEFSDERVKQAADLIAFEGKRSGKIVRNLLAFARRSGEQKTPADLSEIVRTVLGLHAARLRDQGLQTVLDLSHDLPAVAVNVAQFHQVILNLINNAEDALRVSGVGSTITIRTFQDRDWISLVAEDDGPGIPSDVLPKVFDPFFTTKQVGQGTGLGLSICYGIVHEHRGTIQALRLYPHGTRIVIRLPRRTETLTVLDTQDQPDTWLPASVLLVDDETNIRQVLASYLGNLGCNVFEAGNGQDALELLQEDARDSEVILLDVKMPVMDGLELHQALLDDHPELAARCVFMTGTQDDELADRIQTLGVPVLAKPFARQDVLRTFSVLHNLTHPSPQPTRRQQQ